MTVVDRHCSDNIDMAVRLRIEIRYILSQRFIDMLYYVS